MRALNSLNKKFGTSTKSGICYNSITILYLYVPLYVIVLYFITPIVRRFTHANGVQQYTLCISSAPCVRVCERVGIRYTKIYGWTDILTHRRRCWVQVRNVIVALSVTTTDETCLVSEVGMQGRQDLWLWNAGTRLYVRENTRFRVLREAPIVFPVHC